MIVEAELLLSWTTGNILHCKMPSSYQGGSEATTENSHNGRGNKHPLFF